MEEERGFTLNYDKYNWEEHSHFAVSASPTLRMTSMLSSREGSALISSKLMHSHFILEDAGKDASGKAVVDFGEGKKNIFALEGTEILIHKDKEIQLAVNEFGSGRAVYISGLPYSFENSRLLYRSILWRQVCI